MIRRCMCALAAAIRRAIRAPRGNHFNKAHGIRHLRRRARPVASAVRKSSEDDEALVFTFLPA